VIQFPDERRAVTFERYLKPGQVLRSLSGTYDSLAIHRERETV
jgi:hypothetical protein